MTLDLLVILVLGAAAFLYAAFVRYYENEREQKHVPETVRMEQVI